MLEGQVVVRCAGLYTLDGTHIRMVGHKPHELHDLTALVEPPHLMTLEMGDWPTHFAPTQDRHVSSCHLSSDRRKGSCTCADTCIALCMVMGIAVIKVLVLTRG